MNPLIDRTYEVDPSYGMRMRGFIAAMTGECAGIG